LGQPDVFIRVYGFNSAFASCCHKGQVFGRRGADNRCLFFSQTFEFACLHLSSSHISLKPYWDRVCVLFFPISGWLSRGAYKTVSYDHGIKITQLMSNNIVNVFFRRSYQGSIESYWTITLRIVSHSIRWDLTLGE
jgi:hypothetical protein